MDFGIEDNEILSAIECHTTLKKNYSDIDLVLFVADKIKWDQGSHHTYFTLLMVSFINYTEQTILSVFNRFIKINYYGLPQMLFCCL